MQLAPKFDIVCNQQCSCVRMSDIETDAFSHLLDLTSDPQKINDVFPLVQQVKCKSTLIRHFKPKRLVYPSRQKTPSPRSVSRSSSRNSQNRPSSRNEKSKEAEDDEVQCSRRNTIASRAKQPHNRRFAAPTYTRRDTMPSKHAPPG
jgi:hypothetical protein